MFYAAIVRECPRSRDATNAPEPPKTCRSQACGARWRGFRMVLKPRRKFETVLRAIRFTRGGFGNSARSHHGGRARVRCSLTPRSHVGMEILHANPSARQ